MYVTCKYASVVCVLSLCTCITNATICDRPKASRRSIANRTVGSLVISLRVRPTNGEGDAVPISDWPIHLTAFTRVSDACTALNVTGAKIKGEP